MEPSPTQSVDDLPRVAKNGSIVTQSVTEESRTVESVTDCSSSLDERALAAGEGIADLDVSDCIASDDQSSCEEDDEQNGEEQDRYKDELTTSKDVPLIIKRLRQENRRLHHTCIANQKSLASQKNALDSLAMERDALRRKLHQNQRLEPAINSSSPHISDAVNVKGLLTRSHVTLQRTCSSPPNSTRVNNHNKVEESDIDDLSSPAHTSQPATEGFDEDPPIVCRMAERVRLKKANNLGQSVTGSDLRHFGVTNTAVAESLTASVSEEGQSQELFYALATAGGSLVPHERLKEYEVEIDRLNARVDSLKAQNDVLSITLCESKAHCDHLSILMGKFESNSSGLQLTVSTLDMTVEALEVLAALLESELGLLLSTYRATEGGTSRWRDGEECDELLEAMKLSQEHRRSTENVARHLLSKCERTLNIKLPTSEIDFNSSGNKPDEISRIEEIRIRELINHLKDDRKNISTSVVYLEPLLTDPLTTNHPLPEAEALKLDLENSVLLQELTAVREERAELRAQVYLLEREKTGLELKVSDCEARLSATLATLDLLKAQLKSDVFVKKNESLSRDCGPVESSSSNQIQAMVKEDSLVKEYSDGDSTETPNGNSQHDMHERIATLVTAMESLSASSSLRHAQNQQFIEDLKKANGALVAAVERLKKKYALRVKRMEMQQTAMMERRAMEVHSLKQTIMELEDQLHNEQVEEIEDDIIYEEEDSDYRTHSPNETCL